MSNEQGNPRRREFLKCAGVTASIIGIAGCSSGGGGGGGGGLKGSVKIGVIAPTDDPIGKNIKAAAQMAANEVNKEGGVGDADLKVIVKNNSYDTQQTVSRYQELTTGQNVDLTMGPYVSENQLAIMDAIAQQKTLHMGVASGTPKTSELVDQNYEKYKYYFRVGPLNGHFRGKEQIEFAKNNFSKMGWKRVAVLVEDYAWTEPISAVLNKELKNATDAKIVMNKRFSGDTNDFSPLFDQAQRNNADGLLTAIAHVGTDMIVQWHDQKRPFGMSGVTVPAEDPTYWKSTSSKTKFVVGSLFGGVEGAYVTDKGNQFAQKYGKQGGYGGSPMYPGFHTYDAVKMFSKAITEAGSKNAADIIPILEGMSHEGTAGTIEFYGKDEKYTHDVKHGKDLLHEMQYQWQPKGNAGTQVGIAPEELAEGKYKSPTWVNK